MSNISRYAVVEITFGIVVNIVVWDGASTWAPPPGHAAVLVPEGTFADIGWYYADGTFYPPAVEEELP